MDALACVLQYARLSDDVAIDIVKDSMNENFNLCRQHPLDQNNLCSHLGSSKVGAVKSSQLSPGRWLAVEFSELRKTFETCPAAKAIAVDMIRAVAHCVNSHILSEEAKVDGTRFGKIV